MMLQNLSQTAIQSSILFLVIWVVFRCMPSFPPNSKAWIWRLAFLKPIIGLVPFAAVTLHILAPPPQVQIDDRTPIAVTRTVTEATQIGSVTPVVVSASVAPKTAPDPLLILWIFGASSIAAWAFISRLSAAKVVRNAEPVSSQNIVTVLDQLLAKAELQTKISLLQSGDVQSAMLFGGRRNIVVLPSSCTDGDEIRMMLAHEVAHIARRDLAWQAVTWIVRCLFFFNPIVWLAVQSSQLDHESATDRYACELAGVPVQTYAEMLLRATVVTRNPLVPGALSVGESYRTIHRRLEAMNHFNTKPNPVRKTAVGLVALATIGLIPMYQFAQAKPVQSQVIKPKVSSSKKKTKKAQGSEVKPVQGYELAAPAAAPAGGIPVAGSELTAPAVAPTGGIPVVGSELQAPAAAPAGGISVPGQAIPPQMARKGQRVAIVPSSQLVIRDATAPRVDYAVKKGQKKGKLMPVRDAAPARAAAAPFISPDIAMLPPRSENAAPARSSDPFVGPNAAPPARSSDPFVVSDAVAPTSMRLGSDMQLEASSLYEGKVVSFKFENVDVRQAIIALFKTTNRSFLLGDGVKGTINVSGQNVPFDQALAEIVRAAKIESYAEGGVVHFFAPKG